MTGTGAERKDSMIPTLDDGTLDELFTWIEALPLSRPRKNLHRDFSDGVMVAEIVAHFLPRYVDLHGFMPASSTSLKKYNWETLNKKVFCHLDLAVSEDLVASIVEFRPGAIEFVLAQLRLKIEVAISQGRFKPRRRNRSRSSGPASRNGSNLSLNNLVCDSDNQSLLLSSLGAASNGPSKASTPTINIGPKSAPLSARELEMLKREADNLRFAMSAPVEGKSRGCEDLVPGRVVHGLHIELVAKSEQIQNLQNRVRHLEQTVKLKDERIEQLTQRLDRLAQVFYAHQQKKCAETPNSSDGDIRRWIPTAANSNAASAQASPLHQMAANFRSMLSQAAAAAPASDPLTDDSGLVSPVAANYEFTNHSDVIE